MGVNLTCAVCRVLQVAEDTEQPYRVVPLRVRSLYNAGGVPLPRDTVSVSLFLALRAAGRNLHLTVRAALQYEWFQARLYENFQSHLTLNWGERFFFIKNIRTRPTLLFAFSRLWALCDVRRVLRSACFLEGVHTALASSGDAFCHSVRLRGGPAQTALRRRAIRQQRPGVGG